MKLGKLSQNDNPKIVFSIENVKNTVHVLGTVTKLLNDSYCLPVNQDWNACVSLRHLVLVQANQRPVTHRRSHGKRCRNRFATTS